MAADKNKIKECKLVSKLVEDPGAPPQTRLLTGYVGRSSLEGHTRLYQDATLSDWVEIPNDAVLHTEDWPAEGHPWGGKHVWVHSDAHLSPAPHRRRQGEPWSESWDSPDFCAHVCCPPEPPTVCCRPDPPHVCCVPPKPPTVCCRPEPPHVCCLPKPPHVCCPPKPPTVCCLPKPPTVCCAPGAWESPDLCREPCCMPPKPKPPKPGVPEPCQEPCCAPPDKPWDRPQPSYRWNPPYWDPWGTNPYGW